MCTMWLPHSRVDLDGCGGCFLHLPAYAVPTFPHQVGGSLKDSHVSGMWSRTRVVHFDTYTQMHTQTQMYGITPPPSESKANPQALDPSYPRLGFGAPNPSLGSGSMPGSEPDPRLGGL